MSTVESGYAGRKLDSQIAGLLGYEIRRLGVRHDYDCGGEYVAACCLTGEHIPGIDHVAEEDCCLLDDIWEVLPKYSTDLVDAMTLLPKMARSYCCIRLVLDAGDHWDVSAANHRDPVINVAAYDLPEAICLLRFKVEGVEPLA